MAVQRTPLPEDPEDHGMLTAQLRWAQASGSEPASAADWTVETIAEVTTEAPAFEDVPAGTGLFAAAGRLPDGRAVVGFYDQIAGDPMLAVRDGGTWTTAAVDADGDDRGQWTSLAVGADGTVQLVYQD